jgi:hypothetical protein
MASIPRGPTGKLLERQIVVLTQWLKRGGDAGNVDIGVGAALILAL